MIHQVKLCFFLLKIYIVFFFLDVNVNALSAVAAKQIANARITQ